MLSLPDDNSKIWEAFTGSQQSPIAKSIGDIQRPGSAAPQHPNGFSLTIDVSDIVDFLQEVASENEENRVFTKEHAYELLQNPKVYAEIKKEWTKAAVHAFYDLIKESVYHNPDLPSIYKPDADEQDAIRGLEDDDRAHRTDVSRVASSQGIHGV